MNWQFVVLFVGFYVAPTSPKDLKIFQDISKDVTRKLSFASYYGDHMVLQQAPKQSIVWGVGEVGHALVVTLVGPDIKRVYRTTVTLGYYPDYQTATGTWKVLLDAMPAGGPYKVYVEDTVTGDAVWMTDVMFGDVWICSGQSNMQFTMHQVFNASQELLSANNYPDIRLFTVQETYSKIPRTELITVEEKWSISSNKSAGGVDWSYFSAVCWLYGRYLYQNLQYPIGLVATTWGGTPVEAWSSPDALKACGVKPTGGPKFGAYLSENDVKYPWGQKLANIQDAGTPSNLWNAMVHPFLNMTLYGAIWYQGEANKAYGKNIYNCTFPTMIDDWRAKFHEGTLGQTDSKFPFGFVQLAGNHPGPIGNTTDGFADIRWHQTADIGYVPNSRMKNVFMAVAMDLPDFTSPFGGVHPRDKQDVALRLGTAGLAVAYGRKIPFQGPFPTNITQDGDEQILIEFDNNKTEISAKSSHGFEICCTPEQVGYCASNASTWIPAIIKRVTNISVSIDISNCKVVVSFVRYAWKESPCNFKACAVYGKKTGLPLPPFVSKPFSIIWGKK